MYYYIPAIVVVIRFFIGETGGQTGGGTTPNGSTYVCVPPGFCDNNSGSGQDIDPRIVTPQQQQISICPPGLIPCYTQGNDSKCGMRFIPQTNRMDGNASAGAYPWQAYLYNSTSKFTGSGVLIDNYHVLTAAHKVQFNENNPTNLVVIMGVYNPAQMANVQNRTVSRIVIHPNFVRCVPNVRCTLIDDIALLRLSSPISLSVNTINTACLPPSSASAVNQKCTVSGWGQTSFARNDAPTTPQKQVGVTVVPYTRCRTSFSNTTLLGNKVDIYLDPKGEICAGGEPMRDACTQDGGSPLVCTNPAGRQWIAGLVIWGKNCGLTGVYGVYVNVPYYRSWIDSTITSLNRISNG